MAGRLLQSFSYSSFRTLRFKRVAFFTMLTEIEALLLGIGIHAHANQDVANLEDNECADGRESNGDQDANRLVQNLPRITVDQTQGNHFTVDGCVVDDVGGEHSRQQRAQRTARGMNAESIERIVITEQVLDGSHHQKTKDAG